MFETSFYNAGGTVTTIANYLDFLKVFKDKYPTILIIGLDQYMFQIHLMLQNHLINGLLFNFSQALTTKPSYIKLFLNTI